MTPPRSEKPTFFEDLKQYVGFTEDSTAALCELRPLAAPHFPRMIDDFCRTIREHPGARATITGGEAQIAGLKRTLTRWLETLLTGPHDEAYFESRARIGHVHVRIELPQAYMFTAMNRIRVQLLDVLESHAPERPPAARRRMAVAVQQILDLDLAIMLETYREDLLAKNRNAERLATIGQFAAGIGHELRNPLGVIDSSVHIVRHRLGQQLADAPDVIKHLDRIVGEVKRSTNTINDLLGLASSRPPRRVRTPVRAVVDSAVEACVLPAALSLELSVPPDLMGDLDPDQIRHVLANMLTNATQALGGKGRVQVTAQESAGALELRIRDDGPGIPDSIRQRIFEPLFTTKAQGIGIGLALCRRILEAHGGTIDLEPTDVRARFLIRIPPGTARP